MDAGERKREKARNLRYKKAIVKDINLDSIKGALWDIQGECENVRWYWEQDNDSLINALDGDEDEEQEFKMMFSDLSAECEQMIDDLENEFIPTCFDDFFVALGAGDQAGGLLGWDSYEQDYYGIGLSDSFAEAESRKRLERLTKKELIEVSHACFKVLYAYIGLVHRYDCLKAALDILKDENTGQLKVATQINEMYEKAEEESKGFNYTWYESVREFNRLCDSLPALAWIQ